MVEKTYFASPVRTLQADIDLENSLLASEKSLLDILAAISGITAILDKNRQIIYANEDFLNLVGISSIDKILGKRPGEAVACVHSGEMPSGCGTSEACSVCGAVNAILESQSTGKKSVKEARISTIKDAKLINWDLQVTSAPVTIRDKTYYVFTVQDISNEKRRHNLERIFFHDILNSAGSLNGLLTLLKDGTDPEEARELIDISEEASRNLIEEIMLHRQIRSAESGDLSVTPEQINPVELLRSAVGKILHHEIAQGKRVEFVDHSEGKEICTDRILLQRVLINLLKNAFEATEAGGIVNAEVATIPSGIRFLIRNDSEMPKDVQLQMFQRSFSTRGKGRGIGTYSIKLLTENYLKGKVGFTSSGAEGTTFFVDLFNNENANSR
jgi:K+-sensing histidine kinase KdpD